MRILYCSENKCFHFQSGKWCFFLLFFFEKVDVCCYSYHRQNSLFAFLGMGRWSKSPGIIYLKKNKIFLLEPVIPFQDNSNLVSNANALKREYKKA